MAYLDQHPPRIRQFRDRGTTPSGVLVIHTAESYPDEVGPDDGAENVAGFIAGRTTYGSYHKLADSDSRIQVVRFDQQAYGDGTGSNPHAIHLSIATQAHRWPTLSREWRRGAIRQLAKSAADANRWLEKHHGITVPARRISRAESDARVPGFISHAERDPARRSDPGAAFPWDLFLKFYKEEIGDDDMPSMDELKKELVPAIADEILGHKIGGGDNRRSVRMHLLWASNASREAARDLRANIDGIRAAVENGATKTEIETMLDDLTAVVDNATVQLEIADEEN